MKLHEIVELCLKNKISYHASYKEGYCTHGILVDFIHDGLCDIQSTHWDENMGCGHEWNNLRNTHLDYEYEVFQRIITLVKIA